MSDPKECSSKKGIYVLVADDDPDVLELFVLFAVRRGWRIDTAGRAREIIDKVNNHCHENDGSCYDAIITDIYFFDHHSPATDPRLSGVTAIRDIRRMYPNVPVVFYTGFDSLMVREQAQQAGGEASEYIVKTKVDEIRHPEDANKNEVERVLDRAEGLIEWVREQHIYGGEERRHAANNANQQQRRLADHKSETGESKVRVSPTLERALTQVKDLFSRRSQSTQGGKNV